MYLSDKWEDYRIVDASGGEKLEYWGRYLLRRPDPIAVWEDKGDIQAWNSPDAWYHRSAKGGGSWQVFNKHIPDEWQIKYRELVFNVRPTGFKHTGLFPEQAVNWDWIAELIKASKRPVKVLNLFAYTGGATVSALSAGAEVCHVDAAKGIVTWAKKNVESSGLGDRRVRYIVDDVVKFVKRELRRGNRYDGIIMDPPSYGRGPSGELWKIEDALFPLVKDCVELLSDDPLFMLINSYTTGLSATVLKNVMKVTARKRFGGEMDADEIGLPIESGMILPAGISGRWWKLC
ncbi:MAG: class I SAM-dependent methyltransferase [Clostridia bacterium]|nr:class I SAM-dependent methyltransferase [Clostridia bacterium]